VAGDQLVPFEEDRGRKLLDLSAKDDRAADVEWVGPVSRGHPLPFVLSG